jgi:hypothetical protein
MDTVAMIVTTAAAIIAMKPELVSGNQYVQAALTGVFISSILFRFVGDKYWDVIYMNVPPLRR